MRAFKEWFPTVGKRERPESSWKREVMQCDKEENCESCNQWNKRVKPKDKTKAAGRPDADKPIEPDDPKIVNKRIQSR